MAAPSDADITSIAAKYSIPPAVLLGVVRHQGGSASYNMPAASLGAYGISNTQVQQDPLLGLEVAARMLDQQFAEYGQWEQALSAYLTGDPNAYQSPTSDTGGLVFGILGTAATNPSFGMLPLGSYKPADVSGFATKAQSFSKHLDGLVGAGGVVSPDVIKVFMQCTQYVWGAADWIHGMGSYPDAGGWGEKAKQAGYAEGKTPTPGAVVWWNPGQGGAGGVGHVAIVDKVNPDGSFTVGEANWPEGSTPVHGRTVTPDQVGGFIYAPPGKGQAFIDQHTAATPAPTSASAPTQTPAPATADKATQKNAPPDPAKVGEFAAQLQSAGIDPQKFAQDFPFFASARRRLMQQSSTVSDYMPVSMLDQPGIAQWLRNQPHPVYPDVTVGAVEDWRHIASIHSITHAGEYPSAGEAARFAVAQPKWNELRDHYQAKAAAQNQPQPQAESGSQRGQERHQ